MGKGPACFFYSIALRTISLSPLNLLLLLACFALLHDTYLLQWSLGIIIEIGSHFSAFLHTLIGCCPGTCNSFRPCPDSMPCIEVKVPA